MDEGKSVSLNLQLAQKSFEDAFICIRSYEASIDLRVKLDKSFETCKSNISAAKSLYQMALIRQRQGKW